MVLPAQTLRIIKPVDPFVERTSAHGMTFGVGPAGYDVRVAESIIMPPKSFRLASTVEKFNMPADVIAFVCDKSTWARRGLQVRNTVIEPGWRGYLTLEFKNDHEIDELNIVAGMPIAQVIFQRLEAPTDAPYDGKYQDQGHGPQPAR